MNCQLLPLPSAAGKEALRVGHHIHVRKKMLRITDRTENTLYHRQKKVYFIQQAEIKKKKYPVIIILPSDVGGETGSECT